MSKKTTLTLSIAKIVDLIGSPITFLSTIWLKVITRFGVLDMKLSEKIFMLLRILPIRDHYYQPLINPKKHLTKSLREDRILPGIDMNTSQQLALLDKFNYNEDINRIPKKGTSDDLVYHFQKGGYLSGDVEYLYNIIRFFEPKKIIEIGCGTSTLVAKKAVEDTKKYDESYFCQQICIEPYENSWLEKTGCSIIRKKVEDVPLEEFQKLEKNDILFIDSSHMIRPQGDVLCEFLSVLPILNSGVLVHIHDIFTPKDYLDKWIFNQHLLWNEQYLLEAFLSHNSDFSIIGALNYLRHHHRDALSAKCPIFAKQLDREPGAFWIVKK